MRFQLVNNGDIWSDGVVMIPKKIVTNSLNFASEYRLKALLLIAASGGVIDSQEVAKELGCTEADAAEFLQFWVAEGLLNPTDSDNVIPVVSPSQPKTEANNKPMDKPQKGELGPPQRSRNDIIELINSSADMKSIMDEAESIKGNFLTHAEQELIVNMNEYFGLPIEVIAYILQYYYTKKKDGQAVGIAYAEKIAKNWSEEGITTANAADEKMQELESSDGLWQEVITLTGLKHKQPTIKQREMIIAWRKEFSLEMITIACDIMRENTDKPTLKYVDSILKNWKKKSIATPQDVAKADKEHQEKKQGKKKADIDSTYNLDEIAKKAMLNDDYDI